MAENLGGNNERLRTERRRNSRTADYKLRAVLSYVRLLHPMPKINFALNCSLLYCCSSDAADRTIAIARKPALRSVHLGLGINVNLLPSCRARLDANGLQLGGV